VKIEQYKILKDKIENNNFERSYNIIDKILYYFSFLGNCASIIFAYFFVNLLLFNAVDDFWGKNFLIPFISLIALTSFELLKRFLFKQTTINILGSKKINSEILATISLSFLLISGSFYLSLNGAKTMADKNKKIDSKIEVITDKKTDSLNRVYDGKIAKLDSDKATWVKLIETSRGVKLKTQYNALINKTNDDIKSTEKERDDKIKLLEVKNNNKADFQKKEVTTNILAFIIISSFIELIILIGVWFDTYYDFRSFKEFDDKISTDTNIKNYLLYIDLIEILYNSGKTRRGEDFSSFNKFKEVVKIRGINISDKTIQDFYTLLKYLKISTTVGNRRTVEKSYDEAKDILAEYYKV